MTPCLTTCWLGLLIVVAWSPHRSISFILPVVPLRARHTTLGSLKWGASGRRALQAHDDQDVIPPHLDRSSPPIFIANNNVSFTGEFIVSKEGKPTAEELSNENLIKIVAERCRDEEINILLWKCLGYRYDAERQGWLSDSVFPKWRETYPEPPDLIGVTRNYEREVDQVVMKAVQALVRSVPAEHKTGIRDQLGPIGFSGFKLNELTPNRTRRAQATNFIIYYRESLWGVPLEELKRRRKGRQETKARRPLMEDDDSGTVPPS